MKTIQDFLTNTSRFFETHTKGNGVNICKKHKIEHTGKTVYSILIDCYLYEETKDEKYFDQARRRALRIATLIKEVNGTWQFWPDGKPKWNMSNGMIDGGAASDSLSYFLKEHGSRLANDEQELIQKAIEKNCEYYLKDRVDSKPHTNQRLWGATGLASAYHLELNEDWKEAVMRSVDVSIADIREDGSIPYVTDYTSNGYHIGIVDTTTYYHSRHIAYAWYALEAVGELKNVYIKKLQPAADFLIALYQEDGVKNIQFETKRWYFNSEYEVGSHAYDVFVCAKYFEHTGDPKYAYYGAKAYQQLCDHQIGEDRAIRDHKGGVENFQCPYFWNSHCAWLTRVAGCIPSMLEAAKNYRTSNLKSTYYKDSDIMKIVSPNYAVTLRGKKQPASTLWGPRIGGGSVLYFGTKEDFFKNSFLGESDSDHWSMCFELERRADDLKKRRKLERKDFRAHLFYMLVEFRARDFESMMRRFENFRYAFFNVTKRFSTAYFVNPTTTVEKNSVTYESGLSTLSGEVIPDVTVTRTYTWDKDELRAEDKLVSKTPLEGIRYRVHPWVPVTVKGSHTKRDIWVTFEEPRNEITVSYVLKSTV